MAAHTESPGREHQRLAQPAVFLLVVRIKIQSEAQTLQTLVVAGCELVEEGPDHVAVGLIHNLQLGSDGAQLGLGEDSPPLLVLPLLLLPGTVAARLGGALDQQLAGLPGLPLQREYFNLSYYVTVVRRYLTSSMALSCIRLAMFWNSRIRS